jgi:ABC-type Zn uptake system ZnuABC Zn-binding protein ZnuA
MSTKGQTRMTTARKLLVRRLPAVTLGLTLLWLAGPVSAKVKVVTTLPTYASIAREIGGDKVEVDHIAEPNQNPRWKRRSGVW